MNLHTSSMTVHCWVTKEGTPMFRTKFLVGLNDLDDLIEVSSDIAGTGYLDSIDQCLQKYHQELNKKRHGIE